MENNRNAVESLIKTADPNTQRALSLLMNDLYIVWDGTFPPEKKIKNPEGAISATLSDVSNFIATVTPQSVRLSWDIATAAFRYEIRLGTVWETAIYVLTTNSSTVILDPKERNFVTGTYTFLIKSIDVNGLYSANYASISFVVSAIAAPSLSASIISNSVLLTWTEPLSVWLIDHYIVYRDSVEIGRVKATFKHWAELVAGTHSFTVKAFDIVGNASALSTSLSCTTSAPPDFDRIGQVLAAYTGIYSSSRRMTYLGQDGVLGAVVVESWDTHFSGHGWATIQAQITAGYPLYFEPSAISGYYEEIFDFGAIYSNITVTGIFNFLQINGSTTIALQISTSTDNISYTAPVAGSSLFSSSMRYAKIRWTFTNGTDLSVAFISGLKAVIDVQSFLDSGSVSALAADANGTQINFSLTFKSTPSLTLTPTTKQPMTFVYRDLSTTIAKILVFDSTGNRINATVTWKARGII